MGWPTGQHSLGDPKNEEVQHKLNVINSKIILNMDFKLNLKLNNESKNVLDLTKSFLLRPMDNII